jgi:hypothetical protein
MFEALGLPLGGVREALGLQVLLGTAQKLGCAYGGVGDFPYRQGEGIVG